VSQPLLVSPTRPALAGSGLELAYDGRTVVRAADIALHPGEVTALIGPNGSGKSTLLRSLARLHTPSAGAVTLADDVGARPDDAAGAVDALALHPKQFARRVTLLSQSRPTPGGVSVREVVAYGRHPYRGRFGTGDADGAGIVERAMTLTGVEAMAERPVDELSGGELQRVWLATCLAQDTGVVLLDEPTTFLDLRYQVEILDIIRDLADLHGVAVGVVLHDLDQAAAVADQVVLLHAGGVRAAGHPVAVLTADLLCDVYGLPIDVHVDDAGRVRTRPVGRHTTRDRSARDRVPTLA
jgi:iron complex transport system ATP-binding protein